MQYNGGSGYRDGSRQRTYLPRQQQPAPVRPPRSTPPKKRKRKIVVKPRFFVFLLILVLLIAGLIFGIRAGVQALVNTEATVTYGMIEDVTTVDALVVRNEECVRAEGYGEIEYLVPEMSYVAADTPVLEVYATGYSGDRSQEMDALLTSIVQRQQETVLGTIVNATLEEYNAEIDAQVDAISAAMRDNPAQLDALSTQLTTLMEARQDYIETTTEAQADSTLTQYYANKTQLESQIDAWRTQYRSPGEGLVSFSFDGLEPYLNMDTLDALDAATVKSLLQESNPAVPEELRSQQNLYRLVQPNEWYVAFTTQASQWKIGKGETCAIYFESYEDITYTATVRTLAASGNDLLVVLQMNEDVSPLINARKVRAVIGGRVEGMMVPLSALRTENSQQGVYLADDNTFVPVRVVGQDSKNALVMPLEEGTLTRGDRIRK